MLETVIHIDMFSQALCISNMTALPICASIRTTFQCTLIVSEVAAAVTAAQHAETKLVVGHWARLSSFRGMLGGGICAA